MTFLLWLVAAIVAVYGLARIFAGDVLLGAGLLVLACLVGPGGYSLFR